MRKAVAVYNKGSQQTSFEQTRDPDSAAGRGEGKQKPLS